MEKYVKIINIIDKSGSMKEMLDAAISGFNEFLNDQKSVDGKALVSTIKFSSDYEILYENLDIQKCTLFNKENYVPAGMTALYDAIGKTIDNEIEKLGTLPIEERPEKTLCVILTDGQENSSHSYSQEKIKKMITEMREDFKWEFVFLGADENATTTAKSMGISAGNSYAFVNSSDGLQDAYRGVSHATKSYRMSKSTNVDNLMDSYTSEKKDEEKK